MSVAGALLRRLLGAICMVCAGSVARRLPNCDWSRRRRTPVVAFAHRATAAESHSVSQTRITTRHASAFGFRETAPLTGPDGRLSHGEMRAGDGLIMVASPTPDYRGPDDAQSILLVTDVTGRGTRPGFWETKTCCSCGCRSREDA